MATWHDTIEYGEYRRKEGADTISSCGCEAGFRPDGIGPDALCIPCGSGASASVLCPGGLTDEVVLLAAGYFSDTDLSIYRCYGDDRRCTGGEPGRTCAIGRRGIACADCREGLRPGEDGTCVECEGVDLLNTFIIALGCLAALLCAYVAIDRQNRAAQSHGFLLCAIAGGQFLTVTQTLSVVNMIAVTVEPPFRYILDGLGAITFNIGLLRMSCLGASDPVAMYTAKIAMIFMSLTAVVLLHCIFVALFHRCAFRARMPTLIGTLGTIFMVFYISVTSTVLEPLQCLQHPNGKWTMLAHPGVLCWETDGHTTM
eukprot:6478110-Amphidinium_carterae.1